MISGKSCFVIMPFKPELNYFYLYIKRHIEDTHSISCYRGDNDILTVPLLEKIKQYIENADILIADCSGRNPNVFYELGIAHTLSKKVILITMDDIKEAPSDIRHYEFIKYQLERNEDFIAKLDNALRSAFVGDYEHLYQKAIEILSQFNEKAEMMLSPIKKEVFISKIMAVERRKQIPGLEEDKKLRQYLLPNIIDSSDFIVMEKITRWLNE